MLLLTSTSDVLKVVTGQALTVDVHASWMDYASGAVTPGRTNTAISSATTTTVVASPASSTQRNVKTLNVFNRDASAATVTVQHFDGTTTITLWKGVLQAGQGVEYVEGLGWALVPNSQLQLQYYAPSNPTGGVSTTEKAMGLGATCVLTPQITGKVLIEFQGIVFNSTAAGDGTNVTCRWGTGTAPINGATTGLGTAAGPTQHFVASTTAGKQGFSIIAQVSGLTLGTQAWFDLSLLAVTGGGASVQDISCALQERY